MPSRPDMDETLDPTTPTPSPALDAAATADTMLPAAALATAETMLPGQALATAETMLPGQALATAETMLSAGAGASVLVRSESGPPQASLPTRIGRFEVVKALGAGAMGAVYAARDARLDRTVAIKVIKSRSPDPELQVRIQREAHAMARLSHPNVAQVYEVGEVDGQTFIAMEYIAGETLWDWQQTPRPWSEVLEVYRQVGQGLLAAHEAGLVHRDFKPQNVLVGDDGRPRVIDFGLARRDSPSDAPAGEAASSGGGVAGGGEPPDRSTIERAGLDDAQLTRDGVVIGTPAYMALEQLLADTAGPHSDQFAYCVAFYEALYGIAPFDRQSMLALMMSIEQGEIRQPASRGGVPGWLHAALVRGLSPAPDDRWPSMAELLAELDRDLQTDLAIGWRGRLAVILSFLAGGLIFGGTIMTGWGGGLPDWPEIIRLDVALAITALLVVHIARRRIVATLVNHRVLAILQAVAFVPLVVHLTAWGAGIAQAAAEPFVLLTIGALSAGVAISQGRQLLVLTALCGVGVAAAVALPDKAHFVVGITVWAGLIAAAVLILRASAEVSLDDPRKALSQLGSTARASVTALRSQVSRAGLRSQRGRPDEPE